MFKREEFKVEAVYEIQSRGDSPFSSHAEKPGLTKSRLTLVFRGGIEGEAVMEEFRVHFGLKSEACVGLVRFTGLVGGRDGGFVLHHNGAVRNGVMKARQTVMPGSASGHLKGLRGEMKVQASSVSPVFSVRFEYYFV
ncbi:MAG: DUF3224 domain-containing protein [Candidatus Omnitrophica bacterium]|nr:DUF3224 domain-containing protein [Candidatus Omnitrophota bacterium]